MSAPYAFEVPSSISGIPCLIGIIDDETPAWEVLDRDGRPAEWLQRKATWSDKVRIDGEVLDFVRIEAEEAMISRWSDA